MSDLALSVKDLYINFYANQRCNKVLRGVSFEVRKGKILCIVGESGCGKSVTANAVMGLLPELSRIESGEIVYHGESDVHIERLDRKGKEMGRLRGGEIAMIFQDPMIALNPVLSVGYQISETLIRHKMAANKSEAMLKSVDILKSMGIPAPEQRVKEYPHQFSGGMRQRAMIAMAMACSPRILIADEPTTALDVTIQAQIFDLMLELREKNDMAIVLITHDMGVVAELADDVAVMYMGDIVESGSAEEVFAHPAHPYTRALLKSIPMLGKGREQHLEPIRGNTPDPFNRPKGCQFAPRCNYAAPECEEAMPASRHLGGTHHCKCLYHLEEERERHGE